MPICVEVIFSYYFDGETYRSLQRMKLSCQRYLFKNMNTTAILIQIGRQLRSAGGGRITLTDWDVSGMLLIAFKPRDKKSWIFSGNTMRRQVIRAFSPSWTHLARRTLASIKDKNFFTVHGDLEHIAALDLEDKEQDRRTTEKVRKRLEDQLRLSSSTLNQPIAASAKFAFPLIIYSYSYIVLEVLYRWLKLRRLEITTLTRFHGKQVVVHDDHAK
jgi:hypothetical protein